MVCLRWVALQLLFTFSIDFFCAFRSLFVSEGVSGTFVSEMRWDIGDTKRGLRGKFFVQLLLWVDFLFACGLSYYVRKSVFPVFVAWQYCWLVLVIQWFVVVVYLFVLRLPEKSGALSVRVSCTTIPTCIQLSSKEKFSLHPVRCAYGPRYIPGLYAFIQRKQDFPKVTVNMICKFTALFNNLDYITKTFKNTSQFVIRYYQWSKLKPETAEAQF